MGEALCQGPSEKPDCVIKKSEKRLKQNEVEQIAGYLEKKGLSGDMGSLISCYQSGLNFKIAKAIVEKNKARYDQLGAKLQTPDRAGFVKFNAFLMDYKRYHQRQLDRPYAKVGAHDI